MGLFTPTHDFRKFGERIEIRVGNDVSISSIAWSDDRERLFAAIRQQLNRQSWYACFLMFPRATISGDFSQQQLALLTGVIDALGYAKVITAPQR